MTMPPPNEKQARLIWLAVTGLAIATLVALAVALIWGIGRVLDVLSPVIWPLAIAAVLAYLLDPVVDFFERRGIPRARAIGLVFLIALFLIGGLFSSIVPRLVVETQQLVNNVPSFVTNLTVRVQEWMEKPMAGSLLQKFGIQWRGSDTNTPATVQTNASIAVTNEIVVTNEITGETTAVATTNGPPTTATASESSGGLALDRQTVQQATEWVGRALKAIGTWSVGQLSRVARFFGIIAGLALIPIYLFYLLLEKRFIAKKWTDYLPVTDSKFKDELVFVLRSINDYLIAFFRGQVLVAICDGVMYGIGFALIGLPYAFLIGAVAVFLTIIPFLGAIVTCASALLIAIVTFGDWQHPLGVAIVFAIVQGIEGYILQPKILGDRVGLHPMVIIVAVMTGTTLLGGLLGAILAIPLAAALKVIMFRYIWKKDGGTISDEPDKPRKKKG